MASSSRNSQVDHQGKEDMSRVAGLSMLSTLESDNNDKTKQDREGLDVKVLFNLGGDPERPVCNVVFLTPLMMEPEEKPVSTPNNIVPIQDDQQQDKTVPGSTLKSTEYIKDDLQQRENENTIAKNHDGAVLTAEDIDGKEAKETIHDPNYHDEDAEG
eukprot:9801509-Ditylum_brightwellii.AAC.1